MTNCNAIRSISTRSSRWPEKNQPSNMKTSSTPSPNSLASECCDQRKAEIFFERTEDGRIAVAGPKDVTLYTREGCHLCDSAKIAMEPILKECGARLREVDVDRDPVLQRRYTEEVPVIFIGPREAARHKIDREDFRRKLEQAGRA